RDRLQLDGDARVFPGGREELDAHAAAPEDVLEVGLELLLAAPEVVGGLPEVAVGLEAGDDLHVAGGEELKVPAHEGDVGELGGGLGALVGRDGPDADLGGAGGHGPGAEVD